MAKMDEDKLKAIIRSETDSALGYLNTELANDREEAWDGYLQRPYGNEIEGRSSVVTSEIQDTVEWIMPQLIRIFASGDSAVEFVPNGPEDEPAAAAATDYANYVWNRDNDGFRNFYTWFKEALLSKTSFVKIYWESKQKWQRESYYNLDPDAYGVVAADESREIIAHTENPDGSHDIDVKFSVNSGKICVEPVPSDEVLFSSDAKDIQNCRFVCHVTKKPVSDLIEQFPDKEKLINDTMTSDDRWNTERIARSTVDEETSPEIAAVNESMREISVHEAYIRVDYDGDGIAEMRKVTTLGGQHEILDNEEWSGPRPFAAVSPIMVPHRLVGLSIADTIKDLQLVKTMITRQYLDSLYLANNPRVEVAEELIVDPAEVLTSKPGGIIRTMGPGNVPAIKPIQIPFIGAQALEGLAYIDQLRENRTGVSPRTQGLSANALHETARGQELLYNAAQSRIELIARVFAETGVKEAFKLILWLSCAYQDKPRMVKLRNVWVPVNPSAWSDEYDMTVNVGLGTGDKTQKIVALNQIAAMQIKAVELQGGANGPIVTLANLFNTAKELVKASDLKVPELYFTDPATQPPPPEKPNPEMIKIQGQMELEKMKIQLQAQAKQQEAMLNERLETERTQRQGQIEAMQAEADIAVEKQKAAVDIELQRQKAELDAQLKILDARLKHSQIKAQDAKTKGKALPDDAAEMLDPNEFETRSAINSSMEMMTRAVENMTNAIGEMKRPKTVVRGPDGKVIGLQ